MSTLSFFESGSGRHQDLASLKSGTGCPSIPGGASHRPLKSWRERGGVGVGEKEEEREAGGGREGRGEKSRH